jgi:hypothetical protein
LGTRLEMLLEQQFRTELLHFQFFSFQVEYSNVVGDALVIPGAICHVWRTGRWWTMCSGAEWLLDVVGYLVGRSARCGHCQVEKTGMATSVSSVSAAPRRGGDGHSVATRSPCTVLQRTRPSWMATSINSSWSVKHCSTVQKTFCHVPKP